MDSPAHEEPLYLPFSWSSPLLRWSHTVDFKYSVSHSITGHGKIFRHNSCTVISNNDL
jgi:hypothetical protein